MLVLPGAAGRPQKSCVVTLWGEATGVSPDAPIEFLLIPTDSGHDYEALTISFAKPSDIHRALAFIGLKPGKSVDYAAYRYWVSKGERGDPDMVVG